MATTGTQMTQATQVTQEELDEMLLEALLTGRVLKWGGIAVEEAETD